MHAVLSYHVSTHPSSVFRDVVMATKPTASGTLVVRNMLFKQHAGTHAVTERAIGDEAERRALLEQVLGLDFSLRA